MEVVESSDLKPFLLLAKTAKGAACAALIKQVLEHPGVSVFGELLDMPSVVALANTSHAPSLELLKLFAYGTWREYKMHEAELPALSDAQVTKLKKLSAVAFAAQSKILAYDVLMRELEISGVRELEDLLIDCIYTGLISGRLDQQAACLEVFSAAGRDVHPKEIAAMSATLLEWHRNATGLMANVSSQLTRFKSQGEEARKAQMDLDEKVPTSAERRVTRPRPLNSPRSCFSPGRWRLLIALSHASSAALLSGRGRQDRSAHLAGGGRRLWWRGDGRRFAHGL